MKIYRTVTDIIGNTPLLELSSFTKSNNINSNVYAKLEFVNPFGSVKDRVALAMIKDAENKGRLQKDSTVIEPTSGNTGIALAAVAKARGYKSVIVMPDNMSIERRRLMQAYYARIVLTDSAKGMEGAIKKATELSKSIPNSIIMGQFDNVVNPKAHELTTGPEIWNDTDGLVDVFISAVGTGGTISGVGKFLKSKNKSIKIIAVEPKSSPVLSEGISGIHKIQGIGAGFVPNTLDTTIYDEVVTVSDNDAYLFGREIAKTEGLLVGISSGAVAAATLQICKNKKYQNKNIVILFPDSGERYLSVPEFI